MKTGDKIRFIHSKDKGIIKRIIDDNTVEVEIEDGFRIPVLKKEVVVVAEEEINRFTSSAATSQKQEIEKETDDYSSFYLAFDPFNDNLYSLYLINDTASEVLYSVYEKTDLQFRGISSGILHKKSSEKILEYKFKEFENWPEIIVQALFHRNGPGAVRPPLEKKFKFKAASFYKSKRLAPILNREAFVYSMDINVKLNPEALKEQLFANTQHVLTPDLTKPSLEVDLHAEKLPVDVKAMNKTEILEFQLNHFEKQLDSAIAHHMDEIIFIHGSGNGTLKDRIHRKLSQNKDIKFFKDARKDKFGYGATLVRIK